MYKGSGTAVLIIDFFTELVFFLSNPNFLILYSFACTVLYVKKIWVRLCGIHFAALLGTKLGFFKKPNDSVPYLDFSIFLVTGFLLLFCILYSGFGWAKPPSKMLLLAWFYIWDSSVNTEPFVKYIVTLHIVKIRE
jgi:hypothetical protein